VIKQPTDGLWSASSKPIRDLKNNQAGNQDVPILQSLSRIFGVLIFATQARSGRVTSPAASACAAIGAKTATASCCLRRFNIDHHSSRRRGGGSVRAFGASKNASATVPTITATIKPSSNTVSGS
jgi:hypothetical protein